MNRLNWLLLSVVVILAVLYRDSCTTVHKQDVLIEALNDTIKFNIDSTTAIIQDIRVSERKLFTQVEGLIGTMKEMQDLVKSTNAYNAAILKNVSRINGSSQTIVLPGDTVIEDNVVKIYPTYFTEWNERWSSGKIKASKDTVHYSFQVYNEFQLTQAWKRDRWYKKRVGEAKVTNLNPNTVTKDFRTFSLESKANRINFGPSLNLNYSINEGRFVLWPGISAQYSLIGW